MAGELQDEEKAATMLKTFGVMSTALLQSGDNLENGLASLVAQAATTCPAVNGRHTGGDEADSSNATPSIASLKGVMEAGGAVKQGSSAHYAWMLCLKDERFAHSYAEVGKTYSARRGFKMKWAKSQVVAQEQTLSEFHRSTETDAVAGGYRTISQTRGKQGRDAAGALATRNMITELLVRSSRG